MENKGFCFACCEIFVVISRGVFLFQSGLQCLLWIAFRQMGRLCIDCRLCIQIAINFDVAQEYGCAQRIRGISDSSVYFFALALHVLNDAGYK